MIPAKIYRQIWTLKLKQGISANENKKIESHVDDMTWKIKQHYLKFDILWHDYRVLLITLEALNW